MMSLVSFGDKSLNVIVNAFFSSTFTFLIFHLFSVSLDIQLAKLDIRNLKLLKSSQARRWLLIAT